MGTCSEDTGLYRDRKNPLEDAELEDLDTYPWPRPEEMDVTGMAERQKKPHEENEYAISL